MSNYRLIMVINNIHELDIRFAINVNINKLLQSMTFRPYLRSTGKPQIG